MGTVSRIHFSTSTSGSHTVPTPTAGDWIIVGIQGRSGGTSPSVSQTGITHIQREDIPTGTFDATHRRSLTVYATKYAGGEGTSVTTSLSTGTVYSQVLVLRGIEGDFLDSASDNNGNTSSTTAVPDTGTTASTSGNTAAVAIGSVKTSSSSLTLAADVYNDFVNEHRPGGTFVMATDWAVESFTDTATRNETFDLSGASTANDGVMGVILAFDRDAAAGGETDTNPTTGFINFAGLAPSVQREISLTPSTGAINLSGLAPSVQREITVVAGNGAMNFDGLLPTVTAGNEQAVTPGPGFINFAGLAPSIQREISVTPASGSIHLVGFAPTVAAGAGTSVAPQTGFIDFVGFAPTLEREITVSVQVGGLDFSGETLMVQSIADRSVSPLTGFMHFSGLQPTVTIPTIIEVPSTGAGSGRFAEVELRIRDEDEILLRTITEFLKRVH